MNLKRILSSALVVIMMFSAFSLLIPVKSNAAHHSLVSEAVKTDDEVKAIVQEYRKAKFSSAEEMFQYDLAKGYLDYVTNISYSIYVNRYTGVLYYRDELTGQMLTSNSYNFNNADQKASAAWASQVSVTYSKVTDTTFEETLHSSEWASEKNQIEVSKIENGLRVSYAVGTTASRCLLPVWIEAHEFENDILRPLLDYLYQRMVENIGEEYAIDYFNGQKKTGNKSNGTVTVLDEYYYNEEKVYADRFLHDTSLGEYFDDFDKVVDAYSKYAAINKLDSKEYGPKVQEIKKMKSEIKVLFTSYNTYNPSHPKFTPGLDTPDKVLEGYAMYTVKNPTYDQMANKAKTIKKYCPTYTFEMMYEDEKFCGYEHKYESNPVFRCSLEYTFNDDNSLSVRLPSNSIVFDETQYILKSITPLKYFGAGNFLGEGYIFLPDGSGSVLEFEDFRDSNVSLTSALSFYGKDYCYSDITGAHSQPLTMPVYGVVTEKDVNGDRVDRGYFAILEEGSSMATINISYNTSAYREGTVYTAFTPYPADKFDLSDTLSVGDSTFYTKVSESKYSGSYVTRYAMLLGEDASYVGMAEYYRNYLEDNGTLSALSNVSDDLPLYLEALGSIEVVEKILTFPVNVSKAITTFEDLVTIYEELGRAKDRLLEKAAEYDALANAEDDNLELKAYYQNIADEYRRLSNSDEIVNIDNINFKLTGFTNGGLASTYPTRVKWERVVGGKKGFKKLLEIADDYTDDDSTFGVYPEFDFQYISNTALFDGVGKLNTVSRMVDNRYASKQAYSNITGEFDTVFAMIVSADALDGLYDKFIKKYSKYDAKGISVSTLGSDLNSNFDEDNPISRDDAQGYVTDLLDRIANESNYSVMISQGNIYAVKYADHILNICTDSSYYRYSSYAIPFVGMVLHGYVNYAGSPLNYSGSPDYDLLRSIENGASLYYIIGYRNTDVMKDDEEFNKYYSVSYENLFDDIVKKYSLLNGLIGDLQSYKITSHEVLIGERVIDESEQIANLEALMNEFIDQFRFNLDTAIDSKLVELRQEGNNHDKRVGVAADIDNLVIVARNMFGISDDDDIDDVKAQMLQTFTGKLNAVLAEYQAEYRVADDVYTGAGVDPNVKIDSISYESKYQYVTKSTARDENYDHTDYTVDNDLVVMVTYENKDGKKVSFILNYNLYDVEVNLGDGTEPYKVDKYGFVRINHN